MNQLVIKAAFGNVFLQRIQRFLRFGGEFPIVNPWFHEKSPFSGEAPNWTRSSAAYLPQHSNCMDDSNRRAGALKKEKDEDLRDQFGGAKLSGGAGPCARLRQSAHPVHCA